MLRLVFIFSTLLFVGPIYGQTYQNGESVVASKEFRRKLSSAKMMGSRPQFYRVEVPINYKKPDDGKTSVFAMTYNPIDRTRPTVLVFTGGPGQSGSLFSSMTFQIALRSLKYNFLVFDQRGVAGSRPETESIYTNPNYWGSENVAKDALAIIDHLKIKKVSVWGGSYGTVTATIFAHFFPERTHAVVLNSIMYGGASYTRNPDERYHFLQFAQSVFDDLPEDVKSKIQDNARKSGGHEFTFGSLLRGELFKSGAFGLRPMSKARLESIKRELSRPVQPIVHSQLDFLAELRKKPSVDSEFLVNLIMLVREFGFSSPRYQILFGVNKQGRVEFSGGSPYAYQLYDVPFIDSNFVKKEYLATRYPLSVPVTYFQGSLDPATPVESAYKHFENVPKGWKQFVYIKNWGHKSILELPVKANPGSSKMVREMMRRGLEGEAISNDLIQEFNGTYGVTTMKLVK